MLDLSGMWRAAVADDELARTFAERDFDDEGWEPAPVPAHWRTVPAFADSDGPVLYRTRFTTPEADAPDAWTPLDTRWWLSIDGAFYSTDVWLDGDYVGDTEGYFFPHAFDVTDQIETGREHALAIDVTCAPQLDRTKKRNLTGVFQHWDCIDPQWNPGGLWRPVRLTTSGPVRIRHARAICTEATPESATVLVRAVLDTRESRDATIVTRLAGQGLREERALAAGENRVEWTVTVLNPALWWPRALGDQPLHDLLVEVHTDDRLSDQREWTIGLRSVQFHDWTMQVNGEQLFLKGSNLAPTRMALGDATPGELARDIDLAVDANLDMVRVHAHVTRPELYERADQVGMLIWQDFPLQWGYARSIRAQARRQAREMVDLLAHHPSVAVWCGHNEPLALDIDADALSDPARTRALAIRGAAAMMLPTWNKSVLDHAVRKVLSRNDPSRPVVAHSGVLPHPPQFDGTDSHLYFGWYHGDERQLPAALRLWPRLARFVSEFGAQAVPANASFCEPERWPDLDWDHLVHRHGLQKARFDVHVPPADFATFDAWREETQRYQADLVRHQVEALRRLKYRPTGGFLHFCLTDAHPAVSWSVLDDERAPKLGFAALRAACAPVIVVVDRLPALLNPGEPVSLDVHVVSDLRSPLIGAEVTARAVGPALDRRWHWQGDIQPDDAARVGTVEFVVPRRPEPSEPEAVELTLELRCGTVAVSNHDHALVARLP